MKNLKPMLAGTCEQSDVDSLCFPLFASPKLDGIRALIIDGVVMSRNLKPIPNAHIQSLFGKAKYNGIDGELIVGEACGEAVYNRTSSGVMSQDGEPDVRLFAFDRYDMPDAPYTERLASLKSVVKGDKNIVVHAGEKCDSSKAMVAYEEQCLEEGYEGLILRSLDSGYKFGRSSLKQGWLLKFKRFCDDEGVIVGVEELYSNQNEKKTNALGRSQRSGHAAGMVAMDTLGALKCVTAKGNEFWVKGVDFDIGSGFTAAQRADLWKKRKTLVGKIVKFKYFPIGIKDRPRFPIFLGFRDKRDM